MEGRDRGGAADALLTLLDGRRLSPVQRRIAQYLLDHMPDSAFLSSSVSSASAATPWPRPSIAPRLLAGVYRIIHIVSARMDSGQGPERTAGRD